MQDRKTLNEITYIRAIACLSVVMLHSIKFVVGFDYEGTGALDLGLLTIAGLLSAGTAAFVFISELLVSYAYPNRLPNGFYVKRVRYILIPFLFIGACYAIFNNMTTPYEIPIDILSNFIGDYHGWFVLVIFQFYLLHQLMKKFEKRISPTIVLTISFLINVLYLGIFNFFEPPTDSVFLAYYWEKGFMKVFLAWIFYFSVAYYFGKNYEKSIGILKRYRIWIYSALPIIVLIIIYNNLYFDFGFGSRRIDMIFFTFCIMFILFIKFHKIKHVTKLINVVSKYSFGIYLLHYFYLQVIKIIVNLLDIELTYIWILIMFVISVVASIITINLVNKLPFGYYLVGKINGGKRGTSN